MIKKKHSKMTFLNDRVVLEEIKTLSQRRKTQDVTECNVVSWR